MATAKCLQGLDTSGVAKGGDGTMGYAVGYKPVQAVLK